MLLSPFNGLTTGGASFVVVEWTEEPCPPDGPMWVAPLHRHLYCDEAWYVLEGRLSFLIEEQAFAAKAGDLVWVPKGAAHTYWNPDPAPARYLLLMSPKTKDLIDAIHSAPDRSPDSLRKIFAEFDAEFLGWSQ